MKLKKFLIIASIVSFIGICAIVSPTEQTDNYNNIIAENNISQNENIVDKEEIKTESNIHQESAEKQETNANTDVTHNQNLPKDLKELKKQALANIPEYSNKPYVVINDNEPFFNSTDLTTNSYETYRDLDELGRCGVAIASIGKDIMPTEERGNIGSVKPTGWHSVRYQGIDGNYLYNRCHLIGYQLTAENANEKNLITGTRYMNVEGMLPFENMVADYVKETGNHVLYRVTPIFEGNNLLASGVLMEAKSVEDNGKGVLFNVYCYNVQPGIEIDYETGDSKGPEYTGFSSDSSKNSNSSISENSSGNSNISSNVNSSENSTSSGQTTIVVPTTSTVTEKEEPKVEESKLETPKQEELKQDEPKQEIKPVAPTVKPNSQTYTLNTNTKKFHEPSCRSAAKIKDTNKSTFTGSRDEIISKGYSPCGNCNP